MGHLVEHMALEGDIVPEGASDLMVDHHSDVVSHIVLSDICDLAHVVVRSLFFGGLVLIVPPLVGLLGLPLGLVLLDDGDEGLLDFVQELGGLEGELDELALLSRQVVHKFKVFLLDDVNIAYLILVNLLELKYDFPIKFKNIIITL